METISRGIPAKAAIRVLIVTASILLVPLVAMQFTGEVAWTLSDFVVAAGLLLAAGFTYEAAAVKSPNRLYRAAAGLAVAALLVAVWALLATGD